MFDLVINLVYIVTKMTNAQLSLTQRTAIRLKHDLGLRGLTLSDVARALSPAVTPQCVSQVAHGKKIARIRKALAEAAGRPVTDYWPDDKAA